MITYPVTPERLDIFTRFLVPVGCLPRRHRTVETTELMLQMVATGRGVSAIPDWLIREMTWGEGLHTLRLGPGGIDKSIHIELRNEDLETRYIQGFVDIARRITNAPG